jgi:hypothetical protein
MQLRVL